MNLNKLDSDEKKVEWLKRNNTTSLRTVVSIMLDPQTFVWNLPTESGPAFKKSTFPDSQGMLYKQSRKLPYFFKGYTGDNLTQYRREALFIELLESIDAGDAQFMVDHVLMRKPFPSLTKDLATKALGLKFAVTEEKKPGRKTNVKKA
jgi:hypothetical protein